MWGKNESQGAATQPGKPAAQPARPAAPAARLVEEPRPPVAAAPVRPESESANGRASIGKSLVLKAQIIGKEDLFIDGQLDGSVELPGHNLTIGANGKVSADVKARNIYVHGTLRGNVHATEKVEIRKTGSLQGDLTTAGVTIEDGAYFKGSIDIVKPQAAAKSTQASA